MQFDNTITLGNVVTILGFLGGMWIAVARTYYSLDKRASLFEQTILNHAMLIEGHSKRMEKHDELLLHIMGDIQKVIGRMDSISPQAVAEAAALALSVVKAAEANAVKIVAAAAAAAAAISSSGGDRRQPKEGTP